MERRHLFGVEVSGQRISCSGLAKGSGRLLATGALDGTVSIWSTDSAKAGDPLLSSFSGHASPVHSVVFDPQEDLLASGTSEGFYQILDVNQNRIVRSLDTVAADVTVAGKFHPFAPLFACASEDGLQLWDLRRKAPIQVQKTHSIQALDFSPDGTWLVTGGRDSTVKFWDIKSATCIQELFHERTSLASGIRTFSFHPDELVLAAGGEDGCISFWELDQFSLISSASTASWLLHGCSPSPISAMSFVCIPTLGYSLLASSADAFWLVDHKEGLCRSATQIEWKGAQVEFVACPNEEIIASSTLEDRIDFWNLSVKVPEAVEKEALSLATAVTEADRLPGRVKEESSCADSHMLAALSQALPVPLLSGSPCHSQEKEVQATIVESHRAHCFVLEMRLSVEQQLYEMLKRGDAEDCWAGLLVLERFADCNVDAYLDLLPLLLASASLLSLAAIDNLLPKLLELLHSPNKGHILVGLQAVGALLKPISRELSRARISSREWRKAIGMSVQRSLRNIRKKSRVLERAHEQDDVGLLAANTYRLLARHKVLCV